jgi:hypothetical protein
LKTNVARILYAYDHLSMRYYSLTECSASIVASQAAYNVVCASGLMFR